MNVINLNIGGRKFSTLRSTIEKCPNLIQNYVNGTLRPIYDQNGSIFIDKSPKNFDIILDYLRNNCKNDFKVPHLSDDSLNSLLHDAEFFELINLRNLVHEKFISRILNPSEFKELKRVCEFDENQRFKLMYRATRDGFSSDDFHFKCDKLYNTLVLVKTTHNCVFGGFATKTWNSNGYVTNYREDPGAFLFSFRNSKGFRQKLLIKHTEYALNCGQSYGPSFGFDLIRIESNSNTNKLSCVSSSLQFLSETKSFCVEEIEVFLKQSN